MKSHRLFIREGKTERERRIMQGRSFRGKGVCMKREKAGAFLNKPLCLKTSSDPLNPINAECKRSDKPLRQRESGSPIDKPPLSFKRLCNLSTSFRRTHAHTRTHRHHTWLARSPKTCQKHSFCSFAFYLSPRLTPGCRAHASADRCQTRKRCLMLLECGDIKEKGNESKSGIPLHPGLWIFMLYDIYVYLFFKTEQLRVRGLAQGPNLVVLGFELTTLWLIIQCLKH